MEIPELEPTENVFGAVGDFGAVGHFAWHRAVDRSIGHDPTKAGARVFWLEHQPFSGAFEAIGECIHFAVNTRSLRDVLIGGVTLHGATEDLLPPQPARAALSAVGAAIPNRRRVPGWLDSTIARMNALIRLPTGWNGYDSAPVEPRAVQAALEALLALDRDAPLMPSIVPTHDSGIQLEWHLGGADLEAEFLPDGTVELWYSDAQTGQEREEQIEDAHEAIRQVDALLTVIETRL